MQIYIVRHAWAEERDDRRWPGDFDRPLTAEGRARFAKVASLLAERGVAPEVLATSPLARCRETAEILAQCLPSQPKIEALDSLAPGSDLAALLEWTRRQGGKDVAWVGHAPDVEHLAAELIGAPDALIRFAKGAAAAIRFDGDLPSPTTGALQWLATAKLLGV